MVRAKEPRRALARPAPQRRGL
ncbi:hypothetical protein BN1708_019920 [Verticillium longisporum]|uniref:Uncharacterized protein n=1 Tax=Verticillium longisporum TaxID=100787 RepID=A0A0G4MP81_VERLO|nr:hypothetical protein BN1708_019920 [Verticillium longisporum]